MTLLTDDLYDTPTKQRHRAGIVALFRRDARKRPIVYVDDADGEATRFFLDMGVAKKYLVPLNYDAAACAAIHARTGLKTVVHADAIEYVKTLAPDSASVVWLDLQCRAIPSACVAAALAAAPFVEVTLALRCQTAAAASQDAHEAVRKAGGKVLESARFVGRSAVNNMIRFSIAREKMHPPRGASKPDAVARLRSAGPHLKAGEPAKLGKPAKPHLAAAAAVGRTVHLPPTLWSGTTAGYDDVARTPDGRFKFRVTGTYRRKRLVVCAVTAATGAIASAAEQWTLTPEQVWSYAQ